VIGASFAEIFFGNSVMIGLPCLTLPESDLAWLRAAAAADPALEISVDLVTLTVSVNGRSLSASMPDSSRQALVSGEWDGTGLLLQDYDAVRAVAGRLPYIAGFNETNN